MAVIRIFKHSNNEDLNKLFVKSKNGELNDL